MAEKETIATSSCETSSTLPPITPNDDPSISSNSINKTITSSQRTQMKTLMTQSYQQQQQSQYQPAAQTTRLATTRPANQHSARVRNITGKLLESHGAELRRTLFSLRQMFQDDPELATEFVESDGLECLLKVAIDADQIHQNYILRAIGQLIASPTGMNGLARHNETVCWLYTLVSSQHHLVSKTSIKLLLNFVEHSDNNCLHFCRAIKAVDGSKGSILWTRLVELFKGTGKQEQDVSLLVDAITLINKTLAGIPDQDTYYDFVDPLEELGMECIADKFSKLDSQLKEQFAIYEETLKAEDEDDDSNTSEYPNQINIQENGNNQLLETKRISKRALLLQQRHQLEHKNQQQHQEEADNLKRETRQVSRAVDSHNNSDSSDTVEMDDVNYESANESIGGDSQAPNQPSQPYSSNTTTNTATPNKLLMNDKQKRQHLLQQSKVSTSQQRNGSSSCSIKPPQPSKLARGKQQRASISSCSSSDSYASYGSGYASGSGNSTDHEHKQNGSLNKPKIPDKLAPPLESNTNSAPSSSSSPSDSHEEFAHKQFNSARNRLDHGSRRKVILNNGHENDDERDLRKNDDHEKKREEDEEEDEDDGDEEEDEQEEEDDSQLKKDLSELEKLTDELASSKIFCTIAQQPNQSTGKHFASATIKSTSSNSSSILSTGSNISSLSSPSNDVESNSNQLDKLASNDGAQTQKLQNNESRSTSATPTLCNQVQQRQPIITNASNISQAHLNRQTDDQETGLHLDRQNPQYSLRLNNSSSATTNATSASSSIGQQVNRQASSIVSTPKHESKQQQQQQQQTQQPFYHNLFQWEQLVSKGVTRPLLINDLDFTDLRDEDDCDLLNAANGNNNTCQLNARTKANGEPLTISIPETQSKLDEQDAGQDSGAGTGSPGSHQSVANSGTPVSAPPPMPPPPISPWFNTISASRPQSQFMSSPSPPYEGSNQQQQKSGDFNRDQSPSNSNYAFYNRNSVCVSQTNNPATSNHQYNTMQPVTNLRSASSMSSLLFGNNGKYANKRKKTMKLFWKEVREDRSLLSKLTKKKTIWDDIKPIQIDTTKLEYLFESKAKDLILSKSRNGLEGSNQRKVKITVLDAKRSNAINIGMTKLPPMRTIKSAILKMDSSIMNREGIEKILTTMMPTEEEKSKIIEAQLANPDTPLGTAEQFLLNLASISALEARLKLWAFQLDYAQIEKEVAEPLMDLKQAIDEIERSETFRMILGTLLAIGNFLNSTNAKGFQIDYLEKVPEVKDTVHKHSLLHHLCLFIQEKYDPQLNGDLYSEFSAVNRASKVDYAEVTKNLKKMQQDCKVSWDYLKIVAKHDGLANLMNACTTSTSASYDNSSSLASASAASSQQSPKSSGKLNNLSKLSMITTIIGPESSSSNEQNNAPSTKQLKTKVSDFLTDCAERIMVLMVIHRRVMNRFQKLLVYLGFPSNQIKQTQPQQILKVINEFALEYRTKRERVREMQLKKQCQHSYSNRWQLNRTRWSGSQQCIDSLNGYNNRPCSTASSCASSYATGNSNACNESICSFSCNGDGRHRSMEPPHHLANHNSSANRTMSPSGFSQISNYSDYLFDQSYCNSRQESVTPVPLGKASDGHTSNRSHSMSVSMFDLQNQQACHNSQAYPSSMFNNSANGEEKIESDEQIREKDEQLRRLLGAGKSLDGACSDLYQMSHWSSTMTRVTRHPPLGSGGKNRATSIDSPSNKNANDSIESTHQDHGQSSFYRYLHNKSQSIDDELEQNSDEEILQSLVRTATTKGNYNNTSQNNSSGSQQQQAGINNDRSPMNNSMSSNKATKNKILSRFNCDRKSMRRTLKGGIELSNVT